MSDYTEVPTGADGRSGIIEHMVDRTGLNGEDAMYARVLPVMLDVSHVRNTENAFRISDAQGLIPTSEEFWTFVDYVARFYRLASDAEIEAHNRERYFEWERSKEEASGSVPRPKPERRPVPGYVYVLEGNDTFKIGRAKDPTKRSETLATQLPYPVELLCSVWSEDCKALEAELHERYASKRLNGEWFDLSPDDVAYIQGLGE